MAKYVQPNFIVDSSAAFLRNATFDSSVYLQGVTHINAPTTVAASNPFAVVLESGSGTDLEIKSAQLGTMAFEEKADYDASLNNIESSVGTLDSIKLNKAGDTMTGLLTLDTTGFSLDGITITTIDTSAEGIGSGLDSALPTSGLVKSYVDSQISSQVTASNGLTEDGQDIQLGGALTRDTSIDVKTFNFILEGLGSGGTEKTTLVLGTNNEIQTVELGTMAFETATNYATISFVNSSLGTRDTRLDNHDISIGDLDLLTQLHDNSIGLLEAAQVTAWNGLTESTDNSIGLGGTLDKDTEIITDGNLFQLTGDINIIGDLTVDGSLTSINSVNLDVSDNIITINAGETGDGVSRGYAGLLVDRGTSTNYYFGFAESTDTFRIGIQDEGGLPADTQAVATREDSPNTNSVPYWNDTENRFDTDVNFTYSGGVLTSNNLTLTGLSAQASEFTALFIDDSNIVGTRELGTGAFATIADYATLTYVNDELAIIDTSISALESSVTDLSTNKLDAVATVTGIVGGHEVYSDELDNVAYIKKLVAGTGATLTSDSSTVTISVTGAAGYVSKYTGTFDGTASTSTTITAATHELGTGPFNISVYDAGEKVETGISFNGSGDITLEWSSGSLSASCSYIISG